MNMLILVFYVVLFIGIFYFLAIRPQRRQKAQHQEMLSMLKRGDEVVTIGGMYGTVKKIGADWVIVEVAPRTSIKFMKRAVSQITTVEPEIEEEYVAEEEYADEDQAALEAGEYDEAVADEEEYAEEEYAEEDLPEDEYDEEEYAEEEIAEEEPEAELAEEPSDAAGEVAESPEAEEAPEAEAPEKPVK